MGTDFGRSGDPQWYVLRVGVGTRAWHFQVRSYEEGTEGARCAACLHPGTKQTPQGPRREQEHEVRARAQALVHALHEGGATRERALRGRRQA